MVVVVVEVVELVAVAAASVVGSLAVKLTQTDRTGGVVEGDHSILVIR